jgi:hypothetical protein
MQALVDIITSSVAEIVILVVGYVATKALSEVKKHFSKLREKDELGIIDAITDRAVEYAEAELRGSRGIEKRNFAVDKAVSMLGTRGINISRDEVIAGIENGVTKLKTKQSSAEILNSLNNDRGFLK